MAYLTTSGTGGGAFTCPAAVSEFLAVETPQQVWLYKQQLEYGQSRSSNVLESTDS